MHMCMFTHIYVSMYESNNCKAHLFPRTINFGTEFEIWISNFGI